MIKIDKRCWHFGNFAKFSEIVFGKTLNTEHLMDSGKLHHQEEFVEILPNGTTEFWKPDNKSNTWYVKMVKGSDYYIVPKRFSQKFPIDVTIDKEVKLKSSDTHVWKLVLAANSLAIPEHKTGTLKQFLQRWNPMEHSDLHSWYLLKMIMLAKGVKMGICGGYALGKNANLQIRRYLDRKTLPKIKASTKAMIYRELYFNDYINLDEITSWNKTILGEVEDFIAEAGDESPDMQKHATDRNKSLEMMDNVLHKSLTFTFNPYDEKENPYTFEEKFRNPGKIKSRYPILFLEGKVLDSVDKPNAEQSRIIIKEHSDEFKTIASEFMYWRNNYDKHLHNWDRGQADFHQRHLSNISPLLDVIDVFCESQHEFDTWMRFLNTARDRYKDIAKGSAGLKTDIEEETV